MSDSFDLGSDSSKSSDAELQEFLVGEQQKQQFQSQIHDLNDMCWDKCVDKPSTKLDSRTETCLVNCVGRFLDTSFLITNRFTQLIQKSGSR